MFGGRRLARGYDRRQRRRRIATLVRYVSWTALWGGIVISMGLSVSTGGMSLGPLALGALVMCVLHPAAWLLEREA